MERENRLRRTCAAGLRTRAEGQSSLGGRMTLLVHHRVMPGSGKSVKEMSFANTRLLLPSSQRSVAVLPLTSESI
jgi:hypothetical protein